MADKVEESIDIKRDPEFNGALRPPSQLSLWVEAAQQRLGLAGPDVALSPEEEARRARDRTINALLERMSVSNVARSLVFEITVETEAAQKSALVADTIAELYILDQIEVKFEATEQATVWLSGRVAELQVQLETSEAEVASFSAATDLVSVEALQAQEVQLKDIRERVADQEIVVAEAAARFANLSAAQGRAAQAAAAEDIQLGRLLPRASEDPDVAAAFDLRFDQLRDRAELEIARSQDQLEALQRSQVALSEQIDRQSTDLIRLQQLTRESEAVRLLYEYFLGRLQETAAQQGIQPADSRVLSSAVIPLRPASPRIPVVLILSAFLGVLAGIVIVVLREARTSGFRTAQELEQHTGYPVLGQIPTIPARRRKRALNYLIEKPTSAAAEAYRNLRTSVMLSNVDSPPKVILSTSCVPGEGKTTNSLALSQNFAGLGKKVLLIEGDIRRRTFSQYFDNLPKQGLVAVMTGEAALEDVLVEDPQLNISVLAGDKTNANAADIFASEKFRSLIADMRQRYDIVIIDAPPILVVPDARLIAETVDALLFTVHWDKTSKYQLDEAMRMLHASGQRISGTVLSQIHPGRMKSYGYGGRYGAYAGYGAQYYTN